MSDAVAIATGVGGIVTAIGGIMGIIFAFRTSKMNTDLAVRKLDMEDDASVVAQWQKIADERKVELIREREKNETLERELRHMRTNCNRHCERTVPDDPPQNNMTKLPTVP